MALAFTSGGSSGGTGTVKSVKAGDTSIVVGGTATDPTLETADLSTIAADHATSGSVALNAQKITGLANGTLAQDAAAFGQIPAALPPSGTAGGDLSGTYPNPTVKAITETSGPTDLVVGTITDGQFLKRVGSTLVSAAAGTGTVTSVAAADTSVVVGGTAVAPTIRTATLDVIAADHPPAADWSNNSHKITAVTDPASAQDAATKHYVDSVTPGNAGGKGHLTTATAANTPADLEPGADGTVLMADSTQATGLSWTGGMSLISSTILGADTASIDLTSIPATYKHLRLEIIVRVTTSATTGNAAFRFNNDSTLVYSYAFSGTSVFGAAQLLVGCTGANADAGMFSSQSFVIPYYAQTTANKAMTGGWFHRATSTVQVATAGGGVWASTAAINRITFFAATGGTNLKAGTALALYGVA